MKIEDGHRPGPGPEARARPEGDTESREFASRPPTAAADGDLVLVVPPFQGTKRPALGLSQLKANLREQGFPARILYLNLRFAQRIGLDLYEWIDGWSYGILLGELVFSGALFPRSAERIERYAQAVLADPEHRDHLAARFPPGSLPETLRHLTREASVFCRDEAMEEILAGEPWMVGLTSSFQQNCASLAILGRLKEERPRVLTVMGGANCQGEMGEELLRRFPQVDFVGHGECDHSFVDLVRRLRTGEEPPHVPGILSRANGRDPRRAPPLLRGEDLDRLPYPDFGDYFAQLRALSCADRIVPGLLMETSRGCWWGARHQCTFCALNGPEMAYRRKSPSRSLDELAAQVDRHGVRSVFLVDNILHREHFETLLPRLAERPPADLFLETRAALSRSRVRLLARAGVRMIQPGIESLSDRALRLMRKGSSKLQNVQLLKWCAEYGIDVYWNYLYGCPGEQEGEIEEISAEAELLHHLQPPSNTTTIRIDRFTPYFDDPGAYGLEPISPAEAYRHVYPLPEASRRRIAYFFRSEHFSRVLGSEAFRTCRDMSATWQRAYPRSYLLAIRRKTSLVVIDTRPCARRLWHRLTGRRRRVVELCDRARTLPQIRRALGSATEAELQSTLDSLLRDRLMIHARGRYLSLAVFRRPNCGKVPREMEGTHILPEKGARSRLRRLVTLRIPPGKILTGVAWRASAALVRARTRAVARAVFLVSGLLSGRRGLVGKATP